MDNGINVNPNNCSLNMDEYILHTVNSSNHALQIPDQNLHYQSFITRFDFENYLKLNFPGLIEFSNNNPLDNIDRDDLARDMIRTLLNSQHNISRYFENKH